MTKICSKCKALKSIKLFYKASNGKYGVKGTCKSCSDAQYKNWRKGAGHGISLANNQKYYKANKDSVKYKFLRLRNGAKQRNKALEISFEEFKELWKEPCHYCGGEVLSAGLDRVDSKYGYVKGNIVRCCEKCNRAKNDMTVMEFIEHCKRIIAHYGSDPCPK